MIFEALLSHFFVNKVALELLDYHFADEKVRTMAVKRLSRLTNDEVLVFLLQLVQVIICCVQYCIAL